MSHYWNNTKETYKSQGLIISGALQGLFKQFSLSEGFGGFEGDFFSKFGQRKGGFGVAGD